MTIPSKFLKSTRDLSKKAPRPEKSPYKVAKTPQRDLEQENKGNFFKRKNWAHHGKK